MSRFLISEFTLGVPSPISSQYDPDVHSVQSLNASLEAPLRKKPTGHGYESAGPVPRGQ